MLFNALWRAKRMEFALSRALKRQLTAAKQMRCLPEMTQILQRSHLLVAEMVHFVHQVQYYTLFEVLECSWHAFIKQVQQAEGLDDVIKAHSGFLTTVRAGAFLDDGSKVTYINNALVCKVGIGKLFNIWQDLMKGTLIIQNLSHFFLLQPQYPKINRILYRLCYISNKYDNIFYWYFIQQRVKSW